MDNTTLLYLLVAAVCMCMLWVVLQLTGRRGKKLKQALPEFKRIEGLLHRVNESIESIDICFSPVEDADEMCQGCLTGGVLDCDPSCVERLMKYVRETLYECGKEFEAWQESLIN